MKRRTLALAAILSLTFLTYSHVVQAECSVNGKVTGTPETSSSSEVNGTEGNDTIICDDKPVVYHQVETGNDVTIISDVGGSNGSDTIIIEAGSTVWDIAGDSVYGYNAAAQLISHISTPDTIVVAGTANNVYGDLSSHFDGADDTITVTSTGHVSNIAGDSISPEATEAQQKGDDTITVEAGGVVDNDVVGDNMGTITEVTAGGNDNITINGKVGGNVDGQLGDDTITIGGTVGGTVTGGSGDDNITMNGTAGNVQGQDGNDTITVGGTVKGKVDGGDGDDHITLNDGANGGADKSLAVNGGNGHDTLTFAFTITSEADYNALANLIAANAPSGSITINGQTTTWSNFEQLINALVANFVVGSTIDVKDTGSSVNVEDTRLNQSDVAASALTYCTGSGIQILKVDPTTAQGSEAFTVTIAQIQAALAKAQSSSSNVEITTAAGVTLSATPDGKLVVTAPDIGDASKTYQFSFDAKTCG